MHLQIQWSDVDLGMLQSALPLIITGQFFQGVKESPETTHQAALPADPWEFKIEEIYLVISDIMRVNIISLLTKEQIENMSADIAEELSNER